MTLWCPREHAHSLSQHSHNNRTTTVSEEWWKFTYSLLILPYSSCLLTYYTQQTLRDTLQLQSLNLLLYVTWQWRKGRMEEDKPSKSDIIPSKWALTVGSDILSVHLAAEEALPKVSLQRASSRAQTNPKLGVTAIRKKRKVWAVQRQWDNFLKGPATSQ